MRSDNCERVLGKLPVIPPSITWLSNVSKKVIYIISYNFSIYKSEVGQGLQRDGERGGGKEAKVEIESRRFDMPAGHEKETNMNEKSKNNDEIMTKFIQLLSST